MGSSSQRGLTQLRLWAWPPLTELLRISQSVQPLTCLHHRGFVRLHHQVYLIEPLTDAEADFQGARHSSEKHGDGALHAVYNHKHLRRKRSSCSHGNGTSYYDHVTRPSGLFQLGSLVMLRKVNIAQPSVRSAGSERDPAELSEVPPLGRFEEKNLCLCVDLQI